MRSLKASHHGLIPLIPLSRLPRKPTSARTIHLVRDEHKCMPGRKRLRCWFARYGRRVLNFILPLTFLSFYNVEGCIPYGHTESSHDRTELYAAPGLVDNGTMNLHSFDLLPWMPPLGSDNRNLSQCTYLLPLFI